MAASPQNQRRKSPRPPLDAEALQALALFYAGRYATSRAKLARYLERKIAERGWAEPAGPDVAALVSRLAELRYVDDEAYARMTSGAMQRRGLGTRRIAQALHHAGIGEEERGPALGLSEHERWQAAERLARRKRIGPFAPVRPDRPLREKQIAAFLRAGHDLAQARAWVDARPGEPPPEPEREETTWRTDLAED